MSALIRLYPAAWRARYGPELEDLAALRPLGVRGSIDVVRGAADAHLHPELVDPVGRPATVGLAPVTRQRFEDLRVARRLGRAAWIGAGLWLVGWVIAANGPIVRDGANEYRDGAAAMPFILLAMVFLSAGLLGQLVRLPSTARVGRIGAAVAAVMLPIWGLGPWNMMFGAIALAGLIILAIASVQARQWSWRAAGALALPALAGAGVFAWVLSGLAGAGDGVERMEPMVVAVLAFTPIWLVIGGTLQALPPVVESDEVAALAIVREPSGA
ncbi:MAG: hypothetical protein HW391_542 [Chloroflexi bacterium]|nr:hypothetical protein [Chloroflexota bacterium]